MLANDYFIGKVCTITTVQINFRFQEDPMMAYFNGIIEAIDDKIIILVHPQTKCKNLINREHVVGIHEEQILYEEVPEHAKIIEEYKTQKPISAAKNTIPADVVNEYVNPRAMSELAKKMSKK